MINHGSTTTVRFEYSDQKRGFTMIADKDHERGDMVTHSYGEALTNWDFFTLYGFIFEKESALGYKLTISIKKMPLYEKKLACIAPKYHE